jgi:hypothetical protein
MVKLNPCGQLLRFALIGWNVFVVLIGLAAIGVGIWQLIVNNTYEFLTGEEYASGAILSIVAGVVATIVAVLGIIGAIALNRFLLGLFAIVITVFIILELVSGILGFVYRNEVESTVNRNARSAIEKYLNESDARNTIDTIQKDVSCEQTLHSADVSSHYPAVTSLPSPPLPLSLSAVAGRIILTGRTILKRSMPSPPPASVMRMMGAMSMTMTVVMMIKTASHSMRSSTRPSTSM